MRCLVLVTKEGGATSGRAWSYLLLYNTMFIVPLVLVFVLTFLGMGTQTLLEWSKRNIVVSKVLLGLFFLAMDEKVLNRQPGFPRLLPVPLGW